MPSRSCILGLLTGILAGFVVGHLTATLLPSDGRGGDVEVKRLRAQLEAARRERDGLLRNVEEFREVAQRMTKAFSDLERRFRRLEQGVTSAEVSPSGATPIPE